MTNRRAELLAPAGSFEIMKAVIAAGADAVYMGGPMFGARAYADNPDTDTFLTAIDYAHLRGKKLYMTVNTLLKEKELRNSLYDYLLPFYKRGLDAVIVQDLGVFDFVREAFPDLPVHISTQMTVTGAESAEYFKKKGAARVVTARELNLDELKQISATGIEVESFVHGAICYCYSGKCLFSSLAGGRSGNRGRCAQPCRQAYDVYDASGKKIDNGKEKYILSLKDMNTIDILPEILDAGVYSLKIEGRMKKAEYAAGVVSVYRKYLDMCLSGKDYSVSKEDSNRLYDLFNRNGFSKGYYKQHNGKDMMSLTMTDFRTHNMDYLREIKEKYIDKEFKAPISINAYIEKDSEITIYVYDDEVSTAVSFAPPEVATGKPITREQVVKQLSKLGTSDFYAREIDVNLGENLFVPVSTLNAMRRDAITEFCKQKLAAYERNSEKQPEICPKNNEYNEAKYSAQVQSDDQLSAVLDCEIISRVYIEEGVIKDKPGIIDECKKSGREIYYVFHEPLRAEEKQKLLKGINELRKFDGVLCDSMESLCFSLENLPGLRIVAGHSLYSWNSKAAEHLLAFCEKVTAPYELNLGELLNRGMKDTELVVYGYQPMMVTAGCVFKNSKGCIKKSGIASQTGRIIDGSGRSFPVKTQCGECGNVIYNCVPLVLFDTDIPDRLKPSSVRFVFTIESEKETRRILESAGRKEALKEFTRGHIKRGVE